MIQQCDTADVRAVLGLCYSLVLDGLVVNVGAYNPDPIPKAVTGNCETKPRSAPYFELQVQVNSAVPRV